MKTHPVLRVAWTVILGILFISSLLILSPTLKPARAAGPWYVTTGGNDSNNCLSAGSPCATINGAIGKATAGDTIKVATGVYTASSGYEVVLIDRNITLSGGWNAGFTSQTGMATIDGGGVRRGIALNSGVTAIVGWFTIQNGIQTENYGTLTLNQSNIINNIGGIYNVGTLTINNSIINNNREGGNYGVLRSMGTLTLNNSAVSGNQDVGISSGGPLILNNSIVSGNLGYGIFGGNQNLLILNSSTVSDNLSAGIFTVGGATLNNSTISGNTGGQGGIVGGGGSTIILNNSTVSGNVAEYNPGGGIYTNGTLTLNNSTVSGNTSQGYAGGGIYNESGAVTLQNSILAGNTSSGSGPDCYGAINSAGYNLIGNTADCAITGDTTGNITGIDPLLGPLQYNGGATLTQVLMRSSPAINAGNPAGCTDHLGNPLNTDQRGVTRVGRCDIGAYEYETIQEVYLPLTLTFNSCPPLYSDDFSNPASGWTVGWDAYTRYQYLFGEYRIRTNFAPLTAGAYPGFQASDYSVSADVRNPYEADGSYGIAFGIAGDWSTFYTLEIYPDGWYGIYRYDPSNIIPLSEAFSSAIHQGTASNQIKVVRSGSSISAYANGQLLASVTDGIYTGSRYVGLVVFSYDQPNVDIRFDNFAVYPTSCAGTNSASSILSGGPTSPGQRLFNFDSVGKGYSKHQP